MNGKSIYHKYTPEYKVQSNQDKPQLWFMFQRDRLLVKNDESKEGGLAEALLPQEQIVDLPEFSTAVHYLGDFAGSDCYSAGLPPEAKAPAGYQFSSLRDLTDSSFDELLMLAARSLQILNWDIQSRFCGRCGAPTRMRNSERAKKCDNCGNVIYPRISPAVIVAIIRDDKILLAHNRNFAPDMYSLIAGFIEAGEELEDTVEREICEEVSIKVKNIRYYGSQPWPFPDSLMIGFVCDYDGGEIKVDEVEIEHAEWFSRDKLPRIPSATRIAGRIIRDFVEGNL